MALYFECRITKTHSFRLYFWWFFPLGNDYHTLNFSNINPF